MVKFELNKYDDTHWNLAVMDSPYPHTVYYFLMDFGEMQELADLINDVFVNQR